jgi:thiamine phosphate synthase YjbQ (UPF0047 family)
MSTLPQNEANIRNWDADVRKDMIDALDKLAPEKANYRHNAEGSDDMVHSIQSLS